MTKSHQQGSLKVTKVFEGKVNNYTESFIIQKLFDCLVIYDKGLFIKHIVFYHYGHDKLGPDKDNTRDN